MRLDKIKKDASMNKDENPFISRMEPWSAPILGHFEKRGIQPRDWEEATNQVIGKPRKSVCPGGQMKKVCQREKRQCAKCYWVESFW